MTETSFKTVFGSLDGYRKGEIEITSGRASHYVFSNVFEVASKSAPYEKVVAGKNLEYVIEVLRTEGQSAWFACAHDEFVILMDGEVRIDFIKLDNPPKNSTGTMAAGEHPQGRPMGHVVLRRGHQALLPAGCAYRFSAPKAGVALVQTMIGELSVQKWADICLH
ncbi:hydroxyquinol 1,2-dioxygenase [Paraburkholderia silviterrae]|uniref:Hydroxyquinol 1,2-dioxygenase n=1 Tax=Paraburkholderia silviterrae TaxID=2528715 RepID=A0A4R5M712_9BURK|nr:hydroxyquinol 1,2-dioxygenase [Paraburkholderia silviterrae]TDG21983.1 hydroxyquinol 1,2-dioxygenase [Paraburkholderia silviterrae]